MRVLLTGANGWIGSAVARELISAGHSVLGLTRTTNDAEKLTAAGVTPLLGSLTDLDLLQQGAEDADGVIHTAFGLDFSNYAQLSNEDREAIEAFGKVYAGSDRPIVVTHGLGQLPAGETFTEDARPAIIPAYPRASEQTAFALAERGVRASVVRPARSVHGLGERHGFVPQLAGVARKTGVSAYIGDGQNPWPAVHRLRRHSPATSGSAVTLAELLRADWREQQSPLHPARARPGGKPAGPDANLDARRGLGACHRRTAGRARRRRANRIP